MPEVIELAWHHHLAQLDQRGKGDHGVAAPAHENTLDVVGRVAPGFGGLHDHVVLLPFALVTRHQAPPKHGFHGAGDRIHPHPHIGSTFAIHLQANLRLVQSQVGIDLHKTRVLGKFVLKLAYRLRQVLVTVGGDDHEVDRPLRKALPERGRRDWKRRNTRQPGHPWRHIARHLQRGALALLPRRGAKEDIALCHGRIADGREDAVKLRVAFAHPFDGPRIPVGIFQRGTVRRVDLCDDHTPIFHRRQLALDVAQHRPGHHSAANCHQNHQPTHLERPAKQPGVS